MQKKIMASFFLTWIFLSGITPAFAADIAKTKAVLRGLDKQTGKKMTLTIPVGKDQSIGDLKILPKACYERSGDEAPDSIAFLEISEPQINHQTQKVEGEKKVFSGWMFASSPSLSALEHPVYDVWVLGCE